MKNIQRLRNVPIKKPQMSLQKNLKNSELLL